ncbi:MAG: hypothetical protein IKR34_01665 [Candidatus Gastranaerophilales bacterium]|nr:hypothetical protein [Candidatus Gastranaerophilales bacterium]
MQYSKNELTELIKKEGFKGEIVGYRYSTEQKIVIPIYKSAEKAEEEPTMGGIMAYDVDTKKWVFIDFLDYCDMCSSLTKVIY